MPFVPVWLIAGNEKKVLKVKVFSLVLSLSFSLKQNTTW